MIPIEIIKKHMLTIETIIEAASNGSFLSPAAFKFNKEQKASFKKIS